MAKDRVYTLSSDAYFYMANNAIAHITKVTKLKTETILFSFQLQNSK